MICQLHGATPWLLLQKHLKRYSEDALYLAFAVRNLADIINQTNKGVDNRSVMRYQTIQLTADGDILRFQTKLLAGFAHCGIAEAVILTFVLAAGEAHLARLTAQRMCPLLKQHTDAFGSTH